MLIKTTPTRVYISEKNKEGQPLVDKRGQNYTKVAIQIPEYKNTWVSSLCYPGKYERPELSMVEGQEYWLNITENGDFVNFRIASKTDILEKKIDELESKVDKFITKKDIANSQRESEPSEFFEEDTPDEEIPF